MLRRICLDHFRNYSHEELRFTPGVTFLLGANGQGKTNVLEAIYFLSLLRSFRTGQVAQLCSVGESQFSLYGEVQDDTGEVTRLGVLSGSANKQLRINGRAVARSSEFISTLVCAAFIPEDLEVVKGTPGVRRRFMNVALCQSNHEYLSSLQRFNDALHARNEMLKHPEKYPRETITAYDSVLIEVAGKIEMARRELADKLNGALAGLSEEFFPDGRRLTVQYLSGCHTLLEPVPDSLDKVCERYQAALERNFERDCREGATRYGCHRSELACLINGKLLGYYGSEGECRTAVLALRFAVSQIVRECRSEHAMITIVDDVIGELDAVRRGAFVSRLLKCGQVVFAGTAVPAELEGKCRIIAVRGGVASPVESYCS